MRQPRGEHQAVVQQEAVNLLHLREIIRIQFNEVTRVHQVAPGHLHHILKQDHKAVINYHPLACDSDATKKQQHSGTRNGSDRMTVYMYACVYVCVGDMVTSS